VECEASGAALNQLFLPEKNTIVAAKAKTAAKPYNNHLFERAAVALAFSLDRFLRRFIL
jgi:hypothetical protein